MSLDWWTLGIQAINVVILVWLLARFFWRPVAAVIAQRREAAQTMMSEAARARDAAAAALADIERTRAGFQQEREAILAAARQEAEAARTASLQANAREVAAIQAEAQERAVQDRDTAEKAWSDRAGRLAVDIAGRLAARLNGPAVTDTFLNWLTQEIRLLPERERQAITANGTELEAVSAVPLGAAELERCRSEIAKAFGGVAQIVFKTDPALIAGLELHGPRIAVSNSWRADLARILTDVARDHRG